MTYQYFMPNQSCYLAESDEQKPHARRTVLMASDIQERTVSLNGTDLLLLQRIIESE